MLMGGCLWDPQVEMSESRGIFKSTALGRGLRCSHKLEGKTDFRKTKGADSEMETHSPETNPGSTHTSRGTARQKDTRGGRVRPRETDFHEVIACSSAGVKKEYF